MWSNTVMKGPSSAVSKNSWRDEIGQFEYYWQYGRTTSHSTEVIHPEGGTLTTDQRSDRARYDPGGNFGRYARTGEMDDYKNRVLGEPVCCFVRWRPPPRCRRGCSSTRSPRPARSG